MKTETAISHKCRRLLNRMGFLCRVACALHCYAGVRYWARYLAVSERQAARYIAEAVRAGELTVERRGPRTAHYYPGDRWIHPEVEVAKELTSPPPDPLPNDLTPDQKRPDMMSGVDVRSFPGEMSGLPYQYMANKLIPPTSEKTGGEKPPQKPNPKTLSETWAKTTTHPSRLERDTAAIERTFGDMIRRGYDPDQLRREILDSGRDRNEPLYRFADRHQEYRAGGKSREEIDDHVRSYRARMEAMGI